MRLQLRAQLFAILHKPEPGNILARYANYFLAALILVNAAAVAIESVQDLHRQWGELIARIEAVSTALFVIEYLARSWVCVEQGRFARPVLGRLRYALRPLSLLDLIAIVTYWTPWDLRFLRVARLVRLLKVLHLNEFEAALHRLSGSLQRRRELLIVSVTLMLFCVYVSSAMLYHLEHARQPDVFSSIPATFWWACETFTTIGYGDMTPMTMLGRICAGFISVFGIGVFALPGAIITAAIIESSATPDSVAEGMVCEACGHRHEPTRQ
jgi:voltage-gated potassium channel